MLKYYRFYLMTFILYLVFPTLNAYPQYTAQDCGNSLAGKSAATFDNYSNNREFFTTVFIDAYLDPRERRIGTVEEYHHSGLCPKFLVPCWKVTGRSFAYLSYASSKNYAPGVRGIHYWKHPNGEKLKRYSYSKKCHNNEYRDF